SADIYRLFKGLAQMPVETFLVLHLDGKNRMVGMTTTSIGSMTSSLVHPRDVLMDQGFSSFEKNGYKYTIKSTKTGFTINADPIIPGKKGNRHFYVDESGVIRWSTKGRATRESPVLEDCH
ncbi:JAB domain-containing protein, partial [Acidobacteria bacterium AH-259-G07]|nr:JAB domain-containing protein [Acidobacteria bacterium AH-259-G07]